MFKNYFILNRLILELNPLLHQAVVTSCFSQEKNRIILELLKNKVTYFIEISVNPGFPYLVLKESFNRAKKNSIDVFNNIPGQKIIEFQIAENDRIIKIKLDNSELYFTIRGKYSNIHLISKSEISSFKSTEDQIGIDFLYEIKSLSFISKFNIIPKLDSIKHISLQSLKVSYPIIGKEIIREAERRLENMNSDVTTNISNILVELKTGAPSLFIEEKSHDIFLSVETFGIFPYSSIVKYGSINEALKAYINKHYYNEEWNRKYKLIDKFLQRDLVRTASKLNKITSLIDRESQEKYYNKIANLLLININKLKTGMKNIDVEDIYSQGEVINIKINDTFSPKQNIDHYFHKSKSERIIFEKNKLLKVKTEELFSRLKDKEELFNKAQSISVLNDIIKQLGIKVAEQKSTNDDISDKFKHYVLEHKYHVYVGRDSKNNDLLTTKFAKQNDYWFHARSVPGSHVVLRIDNSKEVIPKNILKSVASIAAFHSKAKTAGVVPVSYAFKKYVVKKKGMEPGKVALLKEAVLLVNPELPRDCEYISAE